MFEPDFDRIGPGPDSPPGMTDSKSSKSSSFQSYHSDDNSSVLDDVNHFEDIGLDDAISVHSHSQSASRLHPQDAHAKPIHSSHYALGAPDARGPARGHHGSRHGDGMRDLAMTARSKGKLDAGPSGRSRPSYPSLQTQVLTMNVRSTNSSSLFLDPSSNSAGGLRGLASRSTSSLVLGQRYRSPSPNLLRPRDPNVMQSRPRRSSWQSNRERKSALQLERECDDDDSDDIPDGFILDNVPISPRPRHDRPPSRPPSASHSPERSTKDRVRSVGNGTPPVAVAQGSLRSPSWRSDSAVSSDGGSQTDAEGQPPLKARARSWNTTLSTLNSEAKALTEKLEEHADELEEKHSTPGPNGRPTTWNHSRRSLDQLYEPKQRAVSALPELPPLRRPNIMIDPLPISKEKEAVLSRTRPSWLPPKDPAEERRHLREYQKMMASSLQADRRREASRRNQATTRESAASALMKIWEADVIPRWQDAIRERRTRDLWWRGVPPRSRSIVWARAIGNELGLSETSYRAALGRTCEVEARVRSGKADADDTRRAAWFAAIREDVQTATWPELRIFQEKGPLHQSLVDVLCAYAMYRSDIGYVTGCNTIAALLLMNMHAPADAFIALANVLNRPLPLSFHAVDAGAKSSAYNLVLQNLQQASPAVHEHLTVTLDADPEGYLADLFTSLGTNTLTVDEAARLWDIYFFEGDAVLVRAAVAILARREIALLNTKSAAEIGGALVPAAARPEKQRQQGEVGDAGAEEEWIRLLREAGRSA